MMDTLVRAKIDKDIEPLFDSIYENILHRSMLFDDKMVAKINNVLLDFSHLPNNLTRLCEVLGDEKSGSKEVAELIHVNPSLAGKVLKLVNSSFYGLSGKISSLQRAVGILGFDAVQALLFGANAFTTMSNLKLPDEMPLSELWNHSLAVSQLSVLIGRKVGGVDTSMLTSAGLFHDSGKLMLTAINPTRFLETVRTVDITNGDLISCEMRVVGVSHPLMSAALAMKWHLPERLWRTILFQQHPSLADDRRTAAVLMLSEYFARSYSLGRDAQPPRGFPPEEALKELGISHDEAKNIVEPEHIKEIVSLIEAIAVFE